MKSLVAAALGAGLTIGLAVPAAASDKSDAKKLVITKSDVGSEFSASKDSAPPSRLPDVADCVGKPFKNRKVSARIVGPMLVQAQKDETITSNITILKTAKMAKADRAVLASSKTPDCVGQIAEDVGAENVTVQRAEVGKFGDYSTAVLASYEAQGGKFASVEVAIVKGRAELDATFTAAGDTPFDRQEAEKILAKVADRMDAAGF